MDFKNSFAWLTGMKKLIFYYYNFSGSGPFLIHQIWKTGQKIAGAKSVVTIKNLFFDARQPCKGIFEIHSHRCCDFSTFFSELLMAASIPGVQIFNWKSACVLSFNMQNSNFMAAPESETFGLALFITSILRAEIELKIVGILLSTPFFKMMFVM